MKKCPECNKEVNDHNLVCPFCGYPFNENQKKLYKEIRDNNTTQNNPMPEKNNNVYVQNTKAKGTDWNKVLKIGLWVIAGLIFIMSITAASSISKGGISIGEIRSVGGETMEEAYYEYLGFIYVGMAAVVRMMGLFFASVLGWLGYKL